MSFSSDERRIMLATPGIGPLVIDRLEQVGIDSLERLKRIGVDSSVLLICERMGTVAWANRRRPLRKAFAALCNFAEASQDNTCQGDIALS
jgi:hypothetical protein